MEVAKQRQKRRRGQVVDLGSGSFKIRVPLGRDGTGRRKYHTETLHGATQTKAEKRCTELLAQVDSGAYFAPSRVNLKDFIEKEWLPQKARDGVREASSLKTYRLAANAYVIPALGHIALADITPRDVQRLYNGMQDAGRRRATMKLAQTVINLALKKAVSWHYLRTNPAAEIAPPAAKTPPREGHAFSRAEALAFVREASTEPDDVVYLFHLFTGVRPEELAGLGWASVAFDEGAGCGVARIERVVLRPRGGGFVFALPKTKNGRRLVYFPAHVYRGLVAHRARQNARALSMRGLWRDHGLVFAGTAGDPIDPQQAYSRRLRELAARAGITARVTPYTLRYSFATLALLAGELDVAVSKQMGHARVDFTKTVYAKLIPEMQQSLSGSFEKLLSETVGNQPAHLDAPGVM
jgi:integrase